MVPPRSLWRETLVYTGAMATRKSVDQMGLFGDSALPVPDSAERLPGRSRRNAVPAICERAEALEPLGARVPAKLRLGTSSWSFPGWEGLLWDGEYSKTQLSRNGLAAYSAHPLLGCVGLDRTFYAPMTAPSLEDMAKSVPEEFRFIVKAWQVVTSRSLRHGPRDWRPSPDFLSTQVARERIIAPALEGLQSRLGAIVFQFPPLDRPVTSAPERFAQKLGEFLAGLPIGPDYAIELRNHELYCDAVIRAIAQNGGRLCLTVHPGAIGVEEQYALMSAFEAGQTVVRWMLPDGLRYEQARNQFAPFDRIQAADPDTRQKIAQICATEISAGNEVSVVINNKAEGCAPASAEALAVEISGRL